MHSTVSLHMGFSMHIQADIGRIQAAGQPQDQEAKEDDSGSFRLKELLLFFLAVLLLLNAVDRLATGVSYLILLHTQM